MGTLSPTTAGLLLLAAVMLFVAVIREAATTIRGGANWMKNHVRFQGGAILFALAFVARDVIRDLSSAGGQLTPETYRSVVMAVILTLFLSGALALLLIGHLQKQVRLEDGPG